MKASRLTIEVDMNTSKMVKKLKAIAEHAAALAEELETIDKEVCEACGSTEINVVTLHADIDIVRKYNTCLQCGSQWFKDDEKG
jgi:DNA-directed RNA polymerase subunit M/transcription elongation factor TFIIS